MSEQREVSYFNACSYPWREAAGDLLARASMEARHREMGVVKTSCGQ
jgi:hypothetical protein